MKNSSPLLVMSLMLSNAFAETANLTEDPLQGVQRRSYQEMNQLDHSLNLLNRPHHLGPRSPTSKGPLPPQPRVRKPTQAELYSRLLREESEQRSSSAERTEAWPVGRKASNSVMLGTTTINDAEENEGDASSSGHPTTARREGLAPSASTDSSTSPKKLRQPSQDELYERLLQEEKEALVRESNRIKVEQSRWALEHSHCDHTPPAPVTTVVVETDDWSNRRWYGSGWRIWPRHNWIRTRTRHSDSWAPTGRRASGRGRRVQRTGSQGYRKRRGRNRNERRQRRGN